MTRTFEPKVFHLVLIKPSHYDDDGYVIQWARSIIPVNSLAALYGLGLDCAQRHVLGDEVRIQLTALDETNTRIRVGDIVKKLRASGGHGLVGLVGVQTNQFPRAVDMARQFRAAGVQVCIGGFHVSGCVAMLSATPPELQEATDLGISLFAGEAEGRLDILLRDAYRGEMKPLYNFINDLPGLQEQPVPYLPAERVRRTLGNVATFDAGRGCPYLCSFCTIINVQGRKSRFRSADDVEHIVRTNHKQGICNFFITDDNFARNKHWEELFDRLIRLREAEGLPVKLMIQVDTMCHKIPRFMDKARRAGVSRVFIGMENIHPEALSGARKGQNRITEYRAMLQAWHAVGVTTFAGYILGFPADTRESILRDIGIIQRELPVDVMEFFILTPLPGSADHQKLYEQGVPMDADMNRYDSVHVVADHPRMTREELLQAYWDAWDAYYAPEHVETVIRRAKARGFAPRAMKNKLLRIYAVVHCERLHTMDGGLVRRRYRRERRCGMPLEGPPTFYGRYAWEMVRKHVAFAWLAWQYRRICRRVEKDTTPYEDLAMSPVEDHQMAGLALFTATDAARTTLHKAQQKKQTARRAVAAVRS
jgi:tRNA A37 methylthiotransferase MiaB